MGTLFCPNCPNFSTKSKDELNYHLAKKHAPPNVDALNKCKDCGEEFLSYYSWRLHRIEKHGARTQIGAGPDVNMELFGVENDQSLAEELRSCRHFLVDSEIEKGRHRVFNFAMNNLNIEHVKEKLDVVFNKLTCAAKINLAFGFILKSVDDGACRYFYPHENSTILERSKLVCTKGDMNKVKDTLDRSDLIGSCTHERPNTKWRFYKITNVTIFAALLKDIRMGCRDSILPEPLLRNPTVNCLTFEENTRKPYNDNLCLFRAVALHLYGGTALEEETAKLFNIFMSSSGKTDPAQFRGVHMDDFPLVEDAANLKIYWYDVDVVEGAFIGEFARRSIHKYEQSVKLLRYNNHICYVNNINALFKAFRCTTCHEFFKRPPFLEKHLLRCKDKIRHIYPKNVYQLRQTLFDKLDAFNIPYAEDQKLFQNLAIFDFESTCVGDDSYKDTDTTTWIGKHVPISVCISSNLLDEPIFLCNSNPHDLVLSFIEALENVAAKSRAQMNLNFLEVGTTIKSKLNAIFETLNERRQRREPIFEFEDECVEDETEEENCSTVSSLPEKSTY